MTNEDGCGRKILRFIVGAIEILWLIIGIFLMAVRLWSIIARLIEDRNLTSFPTECPSAHIDGCTRITLNDGCNREFDIPETIATIAYSADE